MRQPLVHIYRSVEGSDVAVNQLKALGCQVVIKPLSASTFDSVDASTSADVLMGATFLGGQLSAELMDRFPNLRIISKYTIGYDDVDLDAATDRGIAVTHCPTEANWGGVAEGTLAMMLAALKRIGPRDRQVKTGAWRDRSLEGVYVGQRNDGYAGITIGIIGLGRVGSRVTELLRPWRVRVLASDPYVESGRFDELGVQSVSLDELLAESDVVSIHCNLTTETNQLIDRDALLRMQSTALLINTARGAIIDFEALLDGLLEGQIDMAAVDVFPQEPPGIDDRFDRLKDRLILSPHMVAANQGGTLLSAVPWAHKAALDALAGRLPANVVNREVESLWYERFGATSLLRASDANGGNA